MYTPGSPESVLPMSEAVNQAADLIVATMVREVPTLDPDRLREVARTELWYATADLTLAAKRDAGLQRDAVAASVRAGFSGSCAGKRHGQGA